MLNDVAIMGRITADIELRSTPSGVSVATFSVACDRDAKSASGERETDFINCIAWRGSAEFVTKYFGKGDLIIVRGRLQQNNWTDKNGNKRTSYSVVGNDFYFGGKKKADEHNQQEQHTQFQEINDDGELPF